MTNEPHETSRHGQDARSLAGGSGILLLGGFFNRGLRLLLTWLLTRGLGVAGFGLYTFSTTVATLASTLAPLGADQAAVFFGARYRKSGEGRRLQGSLLAGAVLSMAGGAVLAAGVLTLARAGFLGEGDPAVGTALAILAPVVLPASLVFFASGILRGFSDMRGNALLLNVFLPACILLFSAAALLLGARTTGTLWAFVLAHVAAVPAAVILLRRHLVAVFRRLPFRPRVELAGHLRYAIPQSLSQVVFKTLRWTDVLMLTWLATLQEVGLYKVALSLALVGVVPMAAVSVVSSPMLAELTYTDELDRLRRVLGLATRWLAIGITPLYMAMALLSKPLLGLFGEEYRAAAGALVVLLAGQGVHILSHPTTRVIPMAGHALLDLANAAAALILNILLNYLLVPRFGLLGASLATSATMVIWAVARVFQVRLLTGGLAREPRIAALLGVGVALAAGGSWFSTGHGLLPQVAATAVVLAAFAVAARYLAWEEADSALLKETVQKLQRSIRTPTDL